jgi:hypothetical protein
MHEKRNDGVAASASDRNRSNQPQPHSVRFQIGHRNNCISVHACVDLHAARARRNAPLAAHT